jgi:hypothetical protein
MVDTAFADSYIKTDAELETLIGSDPRAGAVALKALAAASQVWYCQEATRRIDALPLRGQKWDMTSSNGTAVQTLAFPRLIDGVGVGNGIDYDLIPDVPDNVKRACMEEAIEIYSFNADTDRSERRTMKDDGVKSYSLGGDYSENLGASAMDTQGGLQSKGAWRIMKRYMGLEVR